MQPFIGTATMVVSEEFNGTRTQRQGEDMKKTYRAVILIGILLWAAGLHAQTAPTLPDLKVTRVWIAQYAQNVTQYTPLSTSPVLGQQIYLVCEFENAGANLKGTFRVAWLIDGVQVATTTFGDMPSGMKRNPAGKYTVTATPGSHRYECVLEADSKIKESSEQNNRAGMTFQVAQAGAGTGSNNAAAGKAIYEANCSSCHKTGIMGAPKLGDKAAWAPRIAQKTPVLVNHAVHGFQGKKGMMPAKGGNPKLTDAEIGNAVAYMVMQGK
jgi:cytochrome c5